MEKMSNRVEILQQGRVVQLNFPTSPRRVYFFEREEEAAQFVVNCDRLEKFMEGIVPEDKFDVSFKRLLSQVIAEFHIPVISMKEDFNSKK